MKGIGRIIIVLMLAPWAMVALAQEVVVYPSKGQDQDQQGADEYHCYGWSRDRSGFDPMVAPSASTSRPAKEAPKGGLVRGAVGGAVIGGIIGGSSGAKKGAASGAVMGGVRRAGQNRKQQKAEKQWEQDQTRQYNQGRSSYNRNFAACMEGRGYTVR